MLYRADPWAQVEPGLRGISESICALETFEGALYANTESSGDLFKSSDGRSWSLIYDGDHGSIGCGLATHQGHLYALNYRNSQREHGRILRVGLDDQWSIVYDSGSRPLYLREIITYDEQLYAFAVDQDTLQGVMLTSQDGSEWTETEVAHRYFRGFVWRDLLWLGSTNFSSEAEVGAFRFDGASFVKVHDSAQRYVTDFRVFDDQLFLSTSNGWKEDNGPSGLWVSQDGESPWRQVCQFDETAAWRLAIADGELYVGTWTFGGGGGLYRVTIVDEDSPPPPPPPPPPEVDCSPIADHPSYELCEESAVRCAGVFTSGEGCRAYCASAGLQCVARYGGEPGCQAEFDLELECEVDTGHTSDWCVCESGDDPPPPIDDPPPAVPDCHPSSGTLTVGQTYVVGIDAFRGDEATTEPKRDANDGDDGDNPQFRRVNVARAHGNYWYSSSHQEPGEPDPNGPQYVDYVPSFNDLGVGCYHVETEYRATENRANYAVDYQLFDGDQVRVSYEVIQARGEGEYVPIDLGRHVLCAETRVRVSDPGPASISFHPMHFTYLGPECE
jgi:hypothetical protein